MKKKTSNAKSMVITGVGNSYRNLKFTIIIQVLQNFWSASAFSIQNSLIRTGTIMWALTSSVIGQRIPFSTSDFWSANTQLPFMVPIQSCLSVLLSRRQLLKPDYERHLLCFCVLQSMTEIMWNYKRHLGAIIRESNLCLCCYWISISLIKNEKLSKSS